MSERKFSLKEVKSTPPKVLLTLLSKMKQKLKKDKTIKSLFKESKISIDELDYIPMKFSDMDVSAKCDHGIIYFNYKLLCDGDFDKDYSYAAHEITHWIQQTTGDRPTTNSNDGDYLDNKYEREGFKNQVEYIANHEGVDEANDYVDNLLDYHDVNDNKREELTDILMEKI